MATETDQNPVQPEETTEETPLDRDELWAKLTGQETSAPLPATPVEEVAEASKPEPVSEPDPPPKIEPETSDPLVNDPKLVKRFRDSQQFISTLKGENKQLADSLEQLKVQVAQLQQAPPVAQPATSENSTTEPNADAIFSDIMDQLSPTVREEVETFPELFQGIDALIQHRLGRANQAIEGDLQEVRKAKHEKYVQQKLNERHAIANKELSITNSAQLDLDDPDFAQWVLSSASRKNAVLDFENPVGFVDLVRSYLYDYPDQAHRPSPPEETPALAVNPRRVAASRPMPSKPPVRNQAPRRVESADDKLAFWSKLTSASA